MIFFYILYNKAWDEKCMETFRILFSTNIDHERLVMYILLNCYFNTMFLTGQLKFFFYLPTFPY